VSPLFVFELSSHSCARKNLLLSVPSWQTDTVISTRMRHLDIDPTYYWLSGCCMSCIEFIVRHCDISDGVRHRVVWHPILPSTRCRGHCATHLVRQVRMSDQCSKALSWRNRSSSIGGLGGHEQVEHFVRIVRKPFACGCRESSGSLNGSHTAASLKSSILEKPVLTSPTGMLSCEVGQAQKQGSC
jgi:hypothetical protein